jgi:hypothetical protein
MKLRLEHGPRYGELIDIRRSSDADALLIALGLLSVVEDKPALLNGPSRVHTVPPPVKQGWSIVRLGMEQTLHIQHADATGTYWYLVAPANCPAEVAEEFAALAGGATEAERAWAREVAREKHYQERMRLENESNAKPFNLVDIEKAVRR